MKNFLFWIKVSRPGLWFATIWLYMLPTGQTTDIWNSFPFWIGLIYVTFPLNFLVYGWNDMVDYDTDLINPRKDTYWFGSRGTREQLKQLWKPILIVQLICFPILLYCIGAEMIVLMLGFLMINFLYNLPTNGLRSHPPLELLCQVGYLLIVPLSVCINNSPALPWQTYLYLLLFAWQSHLIGEVMDIEPDRKVGRKTTATVIGLKNTKLLIIGIVLLEVILLLFVFKAFIFGGMLAIGVIWLLIDLFIIYKMKIYTLNQMKLFGLLSNILAILSMSYVWYSGCLLSID